MAASRGHRKIVRVLEEAASRRDSPPSTSTAAPSTESKRRPDGHQVQGFLNKLGIVDGAGAKPVAPYAARGLHDADMRIFAHVAMEGRFPVVRDLQLGANDIRDVGFRHLCSAFSEGALKTVEVLDMHRNALTDDALLALAQATIANPRTLQALRVLDVSDNFVGDAGLKVLADSCANSGGLKTLRTLRMSTNAVSTNGLAALTHSCQAGAFAGLKELELNHNQIGDEAIRKGFLAPLANMNKGTKDKTDASGKIVKTWSRARSLLARLEVLKLNHNGIGNAGMQALSEAMRKIDELEIRRLWLGDNEIGDLGMYAFLNTVALDALPKLEVVLLHTNHFGDSVMQQVAEASTGGHLGRLHTLCLQNAKNATRLGRTAVQQALATAASPRGKGSSLLRVFS